MANLAGAIFLTDCCFNSFQLYKTALTAVIDVATCFILVFYLLFFILYAITLGKFKLP